MAIPASVAELDEFTPSSLRNAPVPPVFILRPAAEREFREFEYLGRKHCLRSHDKEAMRAEMLRGLRANWSEETYEKEAARLRSYWALVDQGGEVDPAEEAGVNELVGRLLKHWPPLAEMGADNLRFGEETGRIAVSMFCMGWRGLDVPYSREEGHVPLAAIDKVETELAVLERRLAEDKVEGVAEPGTAFAELTAKAYSRLFLTRDEEKNLPSPPSSPPGLNGSTRKRSTPMAGRKSKASASSESVTA